MRVFYFDEIDSTSTKASQLIAEGHHAPFVVIAQTQTQGRGRRGRSWVSEAGNIFLTFVMPPPDESLKRMGLLPIKAAVLLAKWYESCVGFTPRIKWPNDLLFGGQKIAGILCESSTVGKSWGMLSIGIGINLRSMTSEDLEYPIASVEQIVFEPKSYKEYVDSLTSLWELAWEELKEDDIIASYERYAINQGHAWWHKEHHNGLKFSVGLDVDGSLRLKDAKSDKLESLASVSHEYGWIYQNRGLKRIPLMIADVGNTAIKIYIFKNYTNSEPDSLVTIKHDDPSAQVKDLLSALEYHIPSTVGCWPLHILSVNQRHAKHLEYIFTSSKIKPVFIEKRSVLYRPSSYQIQQMGIDRLSLMEGWLSEQLLKGRIAKFGLLVSMGTATTIDLIHNNGSHQGGFILSGLQTSLDALHDKTDLLPQINMWKEQVSQTSLGACTFEAMANGALATVRHTIEGIRQETIKKFGVTHEDIEVVISGGYAPLLEQLFSYDPNLIVKGAKAMVLGGVRF